MIISLGRFGCRLNYGLKLSACVAGACLSPLETPFSQGGICLLSLDFVMLPAQYLGVSQYCVCVGVWVECVCMSDCVCVCNSAYNYNICLVNRFPIFIASSLSLFHIFIANILYLFLLAAHIGDYFPALNEFSTHTVIRPQVQHGRTRRALQSTLDATVSGSWVTRGKAKLGMAHGIREARQGKGMEKRDIPARKKQLNG